MLKCAQCGLEHDGTYSSGRFCSKHCSKSFSASIRYGKVYERLLIDDDGLLYRKYNKKKLNSPIPFNLTFHELTNLLEAAGLKSSDWGFNKGNGNNYVLARFNDIGDYSIGNCRFITQELNDKEKREHFSISAAQSGTRNSQYGTFWITNGITGKKWSNDKGEIPFGYTKGRTMTPQ
jgi:hypothetical protein